MGLVWLFWFSAIEFSGDDIDAAEDCDDIAELVVTNEVWKHGEVDVGRRSGAGAVGAGFGVAHDVESEFTVGGFSGGVDLFAWDGVSTVGHDDFEVLNEPFDAAVDGGFCGENHIGFDADIHGSAWDIFNGLLDDFEAFEEFLHADEVASVAIATAGADDIEVEVGIGEVGFVAAQVAFDTAGAGNWAGGTEVDGIFAAEVADAFGTVDKDPIFSQEPVDFVINFGKVADEFSDAIDPVVIDIEEDSADACVAGVEPLSGSEFDDVVDMFALLEEVEEGGESAEVECGGAEVEQVIMHAHEFCEDGAEISAAGGEFNAEEFFDGVVPGDFVGER